MSVLTYITDAAVADGNKSLIGKTLTRPALMIGDGYNSTYGVNVDIGSGEVLYAVALASGNNQVRYAEAGSPVELTRTESGKWLVTGFAKMMPGTYTRVPVTVPTFDFSLPEYGDYQGKINPLSPETEDYLVPLPVPTYMLGTPTEEGFSVEVITYEELKNYPGGYGVIPYGASALYKGGELQEVYA